MEAIDLVRPAHPQNDMMTDEYLSCLSKKPYTRSAAKAVVRRWRGRGVNIERYPCRYGDHHHVGKVKEK